MKRKKINQGKKIGRPRKIRIAKKARTKAFGGAVKGARKPAQIRAAHGRERVRKSLGR